MTKIKICLVIVLSILLLTSCNEGLKNADLKLSELRPGNIKQELTEEQIARTKKIVDILFEVDGYPLDRWIDDFKRDENPDSEIEIWESIASAYVKYQENKEMVADQKKEMYNILLVRSGMSSENVLQNIDKLDIKYFSTSEIKEILDLYKIEPRPIKIEIENK